MSQENVEIVRRMYEAVTRRDAETVFSLYDPGVKWDATRGTHLGGLVGAGIYHGHKGPRTGFASGVMPGRMLSGRPMN
jgi:ketosteroid isomerase-like protein